MPLFSSLEDLETYCKEDDWNGGGEEAITQESIDLAACLLDTLKGISHDIEATAGGLIELTFYITNNAELKVFISEKTHTLGFFNGNLEFEKKLANSKVRQTVEAIEGFLRFYSLVYV